LRKKIPNPLPKTIHQLFTMVDTIEFKLNNVDKYPLIKTQFERTSKVGATTIIVDEDTGEVTERNKVRAMLHHDTGHITAFTKRSSIYIASSHYHLSYIYNISQNFISFNFAVPKYLFGTNIFQFIRIYSQSSDTIHQYLMDFMTGFCKKHFIQSVDMMDVELTRLDLCYNQFFNSKADALSYLEQQKPLLKKYGRSSKNRVRDYETTLFYNTKRYSFKIYHKGTEFKAKDRKELIKKNNTGEGLDHLQEIADRILRYEVTFRAAQINYLFEKAELHNSYIPFAYNDQTTHLWARQSSPEFYKNTMRFVEQSKKFVFEPVAKYDAVLTQCVFFSKEVFKQMFDFFWDKVRDYQLSQKLSVYDVCKKVDALNEKKDNVRKENDKLRREMSYNKPTIVLMTLLAQYYSLDELRKSELMPRSTFFHYQKKLKEVGITSESILTGMPPPPLDYSDYKYYFGRHHLK